jgi:hypothetical protein
MKRSITIWLIICFPLLLGSCSTARQIKGNMDYKSFSMPYEMDSVPPVTRKKNVTVSVASVKFDPTMMNNTTLMRKDKLLVLPFVVVNVWERYDTCIQGRKAFKDDIPSFVQSNLVREINHLGLVKAEAGNPSDYSLEVSIDQLKTEGPYRRSGLTFLFLFSRSEIAGPAVSTLKVSYTLKKGNQVVKQNTISASKETKWTKRKYSDNAHMQMDYTASMVNAAASNFKYTNKQIVNDLNDYFSKVN